MEDAILKNCPHFVRTENMGYEEWLELRKGSLGGSDAGAIMEYIGEWGSPLTVFLQKKGYAKSKEMSPAAKRGKILEPVIREYFNEQYPGIIVGKFPYMVYHPEHPYISANLDGVVTAVEPVAINGKTIEGIGGLEIKSSKTGYGFGADEIPDGYYCQVQHYMAVTRLPWFVVAVYFLEKEDIAYYVIPRNEDFIRTLVDAEKAFWEKHILTGEWPAAIGIDEEESMITGMFEGGKTLALGEAEGKLCAEYVRLKKEIKELESRTAEISANLKSIIVQKAQGGTEKKLSAIAGSFTINWSRYETSRVDSDALRKAGLYEKYVKKSETGRFMVSEKKGA
jgi:putative phage-type endonuclease